MTGPHPAVAATRVAVRGVLRELAGDARAAGPGDGASGDAAPLVLVGCSGGADSLALAAATAFEAPRAGVRAGAVLVDHGLQPGSAQVSADAAGTCERLGLDPVLVVPVRVTADGDGPEAAARAARYGAFEQALDSTGAAAILLAHTRDDQAEQVLLGLARGSGARSLAGMPTAAGPYRRPFLDVPRATTEAACAAQDLTPWCDPHNADPRYARVRARRLVGELDRELGPGVAVALARTARLLRDDADALDAVAAHALTALGDPPWPPAALATHPRAVRGRLWRALATGAGCPPGDVSSAHVEALDALVTGWRGQGPVHLPGGLYGLRDTSGVHVCDPRRVE